MKATQVLKAQHREAERLFELVLSGTGDVRGAADELTRHLLAHMLAEQVVLFPELLAIEPDLVRGACEEHTVARFEIRRVVDTLPGDPTFKAKLVTLRELVSHHAEEEERALLPRVEGELSDDMNERLGEQMQELFDALVAHARRTRNPGLASKHVATAA
ncbi:hemerythrin domain-containing protein [Sorangium sp. So ce1036]|uniref:hemerythrin domain-containing protein n=1 Tax=Sorangium sp. So ce1036 TaxID=3133328 RepID=UPI003EFC61DF